MYPNVRNSNGIELYSKKVGRKLSRLALAPFQTDATVSFRIKSMINLTSLKWLTVTIALLETTKRQRRDKTKVRLVKH